VEFVYIEVIIFGSVWFLSKKSNQTKFFFKKTEIGQTDLFGFLGQKPVQTGLTRFFRFWLGFFSGFFCLGSVWFFSVSSL